MKARLFNWNPIKAIKLGIIKRTIQHGDNLNLATYDLNPLSTITLGNNVTISKNVTLNGTITIGNNVTISQGSAILARTLLPKNLKTDKRHTHMDYPITIEDGVWIGANVIILGGVTINGYSAIGAGAVVTKDVPANCIVAGNPAKIVKWL